MTRTANAEAIGIARPIRLSHGRLAISYPLVPTGTIRTDGYGRCS